MGTATSFTKAHKVYKSDIHAQTQTREVCFLNTLLRNHEHVIAGNMELYQG